MTEEFIDLTVDGSVELDVTEMDIDVSEGVGWVGNDISKHSDLSDRDAFDQHPIKSIIGLKDILNEDKTLKTVYSDKIGLANYYKWDSGAYNDYGYFVSLASADTIKICEGSDIFGVTVDSAAFVGGQLEVLPKEADEYGIPKHIYTTDNTYALVVTSGSVDVRCASDIVAGNYVVANKDGIAISTESGCGYKVSAVNYKETPTGEVSFATISLGIQACTTDAMGQKIKDLDKRLDDAEINISAISVVADDAYSKALSTENKTAQDLADIMEKVDNANSNASNAHQIASGAADAIYNAQETADEALLSVQNWQKESQANHNEVLANMGEIEESVAPITTWVDPNNEENVGATYFTMYMQDGLATKAEMETVERLDEENKLLIEKNAENYQQTISSVDKYVVGEYSQAYGLTVEQARSILNEDMVYIPTEHEDGDTHKEAYSFVYNEKHYTYEKEFTKGKHYTWRNITLNIETEDGTIDISGYMWQEGIGEVWFLDTAPSGLSYDFWYDGEKLYKIATPTWKNIDRLVFKGSSEPANNSFAYWFDGTSVHTPTIDSDSQEVVWEAKATFLGEDKPSDKIYEFCCYGDNIYKYTDAIWTEFDKNVWHGEPTTVPKNDDGEYTYSYCFYNNTLSVIAINLNEGTEYWQARSTYVGEDVPSYTIYDFWYDGKVLRSLWREVNTLAGNINSRVTSTIRQDVDQIAFDITNGAGCMAGFNARLTDTEAKANMGTFWVDPTSGEKDMANIGLIADDDGSSMSFVVRKTMKNADGELENEDIVVSGAGITLNQGEEGSSISIQADCINFEGDAIFEVDEESGQTHIKGGFIKTGVLESIGYVDGETYSDEGTSFSLDDGTIKSKNFAIDEDGKLHAKGADIEGTINAQNGKIGPLAIENGVVEMSLGMTNLVMNYNQEFTNSDFLIGRYWITPSASKGYWSASAEGEGFRSLVGCLVPGKTYTIQIDITPAEGVTMICPNVSRGGVRLCDVYINEEKPTTRQTIKQTFVFEGYRQHYTPNEGIDCAAIDLYRQPEPNASAPTITIHRVKIEEGEIATGWDTLSSDFSGSQMSWKMLPDKCVWWNQNTSESYPLMKLDDEGLSIKGSVETKSGYIGSISIQENCIAGVGWMLDNKGLYMLDDLNEFRIGNVSIYNEKNTSGTRTTHLQNTGSFKIQAASGAYILLDEETEATSTLYNINILYACKVGGYANTYIYAQASSRPAYNITFQVKVKQYDISRDNTEFNIHENTVNLTIPAGKYESDQTKVFGTTSPYFGVYNDKQGRWYTVGRMEEYDGTFHKVEGYLYSVRQSVSSTDVKIQGNLIPSQTNAYSLGLSTIPWNIVYTKDGSVASSDQNKKNTIQTLTDVHDIIFDSLQPVSYKFNVNTSNRTHTGFIAQDVKAAVESAGLTTQDFAGYCEWAEGDDGQIGCGLRYGEFVSLNTWQIQKLKPRVANLEEKVQVLEAENAELKEQINILLEQN